MIMGMCIGCSPYNAEQTVITQAIAVLRRFGNDAHIYLPGVGMLNGLTAGNYLDSAGTTAGTVDQPVGLVLDAAGSLGVELVDNSVGALGSTYAIRCTSTAVGSGFYSVAANDALVAALATPDALITFGKTYKVILEISGVAGGIVNLHLSSSQNSGLVSTPFLTRNSIGVFEAIVTPDVATRDCITALCGASGQAITFKVTVREVTGIAAQQPTTASKPILRRGAVNLLTYSGDFSNAVWGRARLTVAGSLLIPTAENNSHIIANGSAAACPASQAVTAAVMASKGGYRYLQVAANDSVNASRVLACIDLDDGTFITSAGVTASIATATAGYVFSVNYTSGTTTSNSQIRIAETQTLINSSFLGDGTSGISVYAAALFAGTYTAAQIQALGGMPLTTTAPASTALGSVYWQFDGSNDSLSLGGPLFQMADDHWVVVVAKVGTASTSVAALAWPSAGSATVRYCGLQIIPNTGAVGVVWFDGTNADTIYHPAPQPISDAFILSGRKLGNSGVARLNGVTFGTKAALTAAGVATFGAIGARPSSGVNENLNGNIYLVASGKGTITDADLLLIEKALGQIAGVQI